MLLTHLNPVIWQELLQIYIKKWKWGVVMAFCDILVDVNYSAAVLVFAIEEEERAVSWI